MMVLSSLRYSLVAILPAVLCVVGGAATALAKGNPAVNQCRAELEVCLAELATCSACGDGSLDAGEQCDVGQLGGATCDSATDGSQPVGRLRCGPACVFDTSECTESVCGDGTVSGAEECDDGNTSAGDGCSGTCQTEGCGNGTVDAGEECDDGNIASGDGCSADCRLEVIACDWSGQALWLSHGMDGGGAFATGAWFSCLGGRISDVRFVNGGTLVNPAPSGSDDSLVGCNWDGGRWASQGFDGGNAFVAGATVSCAAGRVTGMDWETDFLGSTTAVAGDHACNWDGAIFLSHGFDGGCATLSGFNVTCNAGRLTHFEWVEGCARAR